MHHGISKREITMNASDEIQDEANIQQIVYAIKIFKNSIACYLNIDGETMNEWFNVNEVKTFKSKVDVDKYIIFNYPSCQTKDGLRVYACPTFPPDLGKKTSIYNAVDSPLTPKASMESNEGSVNYWIDAICNEI
jgi:hypothetical protein